MGCEVHRFAKLRSKPVPRTGFLSFVLPLTPHAPITMKYTNTPHAMTGNPAPIMALPNHRISFVNEHIHCTENQRHPPDDLHNFPSFYSPDFCYANTWDNLCRNEPYKRQSM